MTDKVIFHERYRDHTYFTEQGWFAADDYYPVRLGLLKQLAGMGFDWLGLALGRDRNKKEEF